MPLLDLLKNYYWMAILNEFEIHSLNKVHNLLCIKNSHYSILKNIISSKLGVDLWLRWPHFAHYWPPTYLSTPGWHWWINSFTIRESFFYELSFPVHTTYLTRFVNVAKEQSLIFWNPLSNQEGIGTVLSKFLPMGFYLVEQAY